MSNQGDLGFPDARFWEELGDDEGRLADDFGERAFDGLLLDGPRQVRLASRADLPLVGVRASTIRDNILISLQRRLVVVASALESGEVRAATAFRINDDVRRPRTPKDEARIPQGRTVKVFRLLVNERIDDLPWRPGILQSHVLLYDQRSNPVTTTLLGDDVQDPAVRDFLAAQGQALFPPAVWPPVGAPRVNGDGRHPYRARPDSPPAPERAGIALAVERVVVKRAGASCILRGSFALPVLERDAVRPAPAPPAEGWVDVGDPDAKAVLPVTVLLTGDTVADPITLALRVPAYGAAEPGSLAVGHFAVDLFQLAPGAIEAQSYAVWAIARGVISQPALVGVVTEDMLPRQGAR